MDEVPTPTGTLYVGELMDGENAYVDLVLNVSRRRHGNPLQVHMPMVEGQEPSEMQFREAVALVIRHLEEGDEVLVHCASGVNRGPSVAAAAVALIEDLAWQEALERVREARPVVNPSHRYRRLTADVVGGD